LGFFKNVTDVVAEPDIAPKVRDKERKRDRVRERERGTRGKGYSAECIII
jgi:hypothetical protein